MHFAALKRKGQNYTSVKTTSVLFYSFPHDQSRGHFYKNSLAGR